MKALKSIFFFLLTSIFYFQKANAQIVYTDTSSYFICSSFGCSDTFKLDLNNDGTIDYKIIVYKTGNTVIYNNGVKVLSLNGNSVADSVFSLSALIDSNLIWINNTYLLRNHKRFLWGTQVHHIYTGLWNNIDEYLGLKLVAGVNTYHGWARISVGVSYTTASYNIKGYAYNSIPNQFILAGDTGTVSTGIIHNRSQSTKLLIYPNPVTSSTTFSFSLPKFQKVSLKIFEMNGRLIKTLAENIFEKGEHQIEFNVEKLEPGIYFFENAGGGIF